MRTIMKSERQVELEVLREYLLKYELIANGFLKDEGEEHILWSDSGTVYLVGRKESMGKDNDSAEVTGFSESLKESMLFFEKIVKGDVMPVCLENIVDDWKSAFCLDNKESA
ncbi:MAG: DUF6514 family protein [Anaerobutyricum sp.]